MLFTRAGMKTEDKAVWRHRIRKLVRAMPEDVRADDSRKLCKLFSHQPIWMRAKNVLLFASLFDEPDITPLIDNALSSQRVVALPQFDSERGSYVAAILTARAAMEPGPFHVLEPASGCPSIPLNQLDLVLVPGVAFDLAGRRLGRGKGFYDRLLAEVRGHKCGVAFDTQLTARLPEEPHDVRVDSILTPTRWLSACAD